MKRSYFLVLISLITSVFTGKAQDNERVLRIYDNVIFYDGYQMTNNPDKDLDDGVLRQSCSLYSTKLTDEILDQIGDKLEMNVTIHARCDNYDRIGNVNLAFVTPGDDNYRSQSSPRIEIARFITPFMDKNRTPSEVPYHYDIDYLSHILRDKDIRATYDLWLEFEVFGIPYAANQQIQGCAGRNDVFGGTIDLVTSGSTEPTEGNILVPIVIKKPEYQGNNLNNYNRGATDELGKTVKTYNFEVPEDVVWSQIVLITSNHGANEGGEEYNRRWHYVYFDDELVLHYKPGRESCEPFREYNTQANGIYGRSKMSDSWWQSFSNWCPGDVLDTRIIDLDKLEQGKHKIRIEVPDAVFAGGQGDIPVSIYFQGSTNNENAWVPEIVAEESPVKVISGNGRINILTQEDIETVEVYNLAGERLHRQYDAEPIQLSAINGVVIVCVEIWDGRIFSFKVQK